MVQQSLRDAWDRWLLLGVCSFVFIGIAVIMKAVYSWSPDPCDSNAGSRISNPLRPEIWAQASTRYCTGFGAGFSRSRVEIGRGSASGTTVFSQEGEAPDIRWSAPGDLEIDVRTTEKIAKSETFVDDIGIEYVIPERLSQPNLAHERLNWKTRMKPLILAGKVDFSGGDVEGNLRNLDRYASDAEAQEDRFVQWSKKVKACVDDVKPRPRAPRDLP